MRKRIHLGGLLLLASGLAGCASDGPRTVSESAPVAPAVARVEPDLVLPSPGLVDAGYGIESHRRDQARNDRHLGRTGGVPPNEVTVIERRYDERLRITGSGRPREYSSWRTRTRQIQSGR